MGGRKRELKAEMKKEVFFGTGKNLGTHVHDELRKTKINNWERNI